MASEEMRAHLDDTGLHDVDAHTGIDAREHALPALMTQFYRTTL